MRAAVLQTIGAKFAVENLVDPEPKAGEVLVKVVACGVCHSDLHVVHGSVAFPTPCVYNPSRVVTNRYTLDNVNVAYDDLEAGKIVGRGIVVM